MVLEELMGLTDEEFMDSLMVASNIRKLGRMELLYTCVADLVSFLHRTGMDDLLGGMEHYYDPNDYNRVIYHSKSEDASDRIKQILADAEKLLVECEGACDESSAYQLLVRVLKEQTVVEESGARRLKTKEDGAMGSQILQNPSNPDATYREKAGKQNRGYTANVVETVGDNGSIVTDYQYEKNTHSDSHFLKETVNAMEKTEKPTVLTTDGAYSGRDNTNAAIISTRLDNAGYHFQKTNVKTVHTVTSATPRCLKDQCGFSV